MKLQRKIIPNVRKLRQQVSNDHQEEIRVFAPFVHLHPNGKNTAMRGNVQVMAQSSKCTSSMTMCDTPSRPRPISPRADNCAAEIAAPAARAPSPSSLYHNRNDHETTVIRKVKNKITTLHPRQMAKLTQKPPSKRLQRTYAAAHPWSQTADASRGPRVSPDECCTRRHAQCPRNAPVKKKYKTASRKTSSRSIRTERQDRHGPGPRVWQLQWR
jgi:hypothetical protein